VDDAVTNPPRWAPDPLGRHQYRYWDGEQWTEHVADNGKNAVDPPVSAAPSSAPAFGTMPAPVPGTAATSWSGPTQDPTAVLGRRYGAFVIDAVICLIVFLALFFPFATERTRAETLRLPGCHLARDDSSRVECNGRLVFTVNDTVYEGNAGAFIGLSIAFTFLYFAIAEAFFGATLGKAMTGIRVVDEHGNRPGFVRALARWAIFLVDGPLSLFLCGIITSSVSRGHRRLGDMGGNTYVVAHGDAGRPVGL
jgi:uncharacterized RDD family membrane protein YckC